MPNTIKPLRDGLPLRGLISVPQALGPGRRWPLLAFLHGNDEASPAQLSQALTRHGPLRPGNHPIAVEEFIVVAPQLPYRGDAWGRFSMAVALVLHDVETEWPVDPERIYLTGFSFGANGVFDLAARHAYPWAALWTIEPTRVPTVDPLLPIWVSAGQVARQHARQLTARLRLHAPLERAAERIYQDQGHSHVGTATAAYEDAGVYRWLLRHRRRSARLPGYGHPGTGARSA